MLPSVYSRIGTHINYSIVSIFNCHNIPRSITGITSNDYFIYKRLLDKLDVTIALS